MLGVLCDVGFSDKSGIKDVIFKNYTSFNKRRGGEIGFAIKLQSEKLDLDK